MEILIVALVAVGFWLVWQANKSKRFDINKDGKVDMADAQAAAVKVEEAVVAEVKEVLKTETPVRAQATENTALTDLDIAKSYRSQADAMYKEAARLRKQADELDPPKKKASKVSEEAGA
jgi:FtsZ-interacting cell division protein ZipA